MGGCPNQTNEYHLLAHYVTKCMQCTNHINFFANCVLCVVNKPEGKFLLAELTVNRTGPEEKDILKEVVKQD